MRIQFEIDEGLTDRLKRYVPEERGNPAPDHQGDDRERGIKNIIWRKKMTQTTTKATTCCGAPVKTGQRQAPNGKTEFAVWCPACGRRGSGMTKEAALDAFDKSTPEIFKEKPFFPLAKPEDLPRFTAGKLDDFAQIAAPFVRAERSAFARMVKQNVRYVMGLKGEAWNRVWATPEGIGSIIEAMEDAFSLGATLPDMGCFVPYNGIAEFIPSVEAYEFALTTGQNAPFKWIHIDPIFSNDIVEIARVNGAFSLTFQSIRPQRGELIAVAVSGHSVQHDHVIGEVYEVPRLIEKAAAHSASYRYYLQDKAAFEQARTEGKILKENGREYFSKTMYKKGGETWEKKIFADEITNPYDGPDRPEMLRKGAGKSFLGKYIRVRNSQAAIDEIRNGTDGTERTIGDELDKAMDEAFAQFEDVTPEPAESTEQTEHKPDPPPPKDAQEKAAPEKPATPPKKEPAKKPVPQDDGSLF